MATVADATPQAPPGKKLCPHTCSCIVKYSSKERGRSALSTRGAAYWDHIKNVNVHPDCAPQCPGHPLLRGDSKEPPVKKQRMLGIGGEIEGEKEWGYTNMWQGPPPNGAGSGNRDRENRDLEGLTMDTKSDINRWISGGSRPCVYTAAQDTIPTSLRAYSSFIETYANELGIVLQFQRVPQPRNNLSPSPSLPVSSLSSTPSQINLSSSTTPVSSSSVSSEISTPVLPSISSETENSLIALSTTALSADSTPTISSSSSSLLSNSSLSTSQTSVSAIDVSISANPSSSVSSLSTPPSPPSSPFPSSHTTGSSWVFVKALEQRWDVKTWAEWYSKESTKKKHKVAYYLVNIPVKAEDHATFKRDPVTAMLSHRGTLCLNQYINMFDEYLPIPDMDAKLFLAPPWTGAVLTPPSIDRNRTQSLHRVIFGDGLNLVHIWEKLTEDQESRFRKVIGLPDTHDRQLHPFQLKYTVDDSTEVWDRSKEEELQKWGILSNRIELMPGRTLIVPLDMPHVMKKLGPIPASSQIANSPSAVASHPNQQTSIINHHPNSSPSHSHSQQPQQNSHQPHSIPLPSFSPLIHGPLVTPSSHVSAIIAPPLTSPSAIVVPPNFSHHGNVTNQVHGQLTTPTSQAYISFANSYQPPSAASAQPSNFTSYNTPTSGFTSSSSFPSSTTTSTTSTYPNPSFSATPFSTTTATTNTSFQSNFSNTSNYGYANAPFNSTSPTTNFTNPNPAYPPSYPNPLVVNYATPTSTTANSASSSYNSNFNFLSQPALPSATSSQAPLSYPAATPYATYPPKVAPYQSTTISTNFSTYSSPTKIPANTPSITPIHINKTPSTPYSFPVAQPKLTTSNFTPNFTSSDEGLLAKASPVKEAEGAKETNHNSNTNNELDLSASFGMNSSMSNLSTSMSNLNNIINNMTNSENNEPMEIEHTNTPIPAPISNIPSTPQANEKDDSQMHSEPFGLEDPNNHIGSEVASNPNTTSDNLQTLDTTNQISENTIVSESSAVPAINTQTETVRTEDVQNTEETKLTDPISQQEPKVSEEETNSENKPTPPDHPLSDIPNSSSSSISSSPSSSSSSSSSISSASPSSSFISSPSPAPSPSISTTPSSSSTSTPSSSSSISTTLSSSSSSTPVLLSVSSSSSSSTNLSTSSTSTSNNTQNFPIPLLTYSGECSFVGTTRQSFARNVDLIKYWHRQLRKDNQPVSVHVDLALYSLIHYVVSSPSPNLLLDNTILREHFIGAIPHFKEFVADEGERLTRYQARSPNPIHTLLKKEARTDWVCRKCKCHLTNFLIRYNNTSKNEASCFECWEEELELDLSNSNGITNNTNNNNKKEDKKRKEKKKETKGKRNTQKGEAVFRFGHVDALVLLVNKASKLVLKL